MYPKRKRDEPKILLLFQFGFDCILFILFSFKKKYVESVQEEEIEVY